MRNPMRDRVIFIFVAVALALFAMRAPIASAASQRVLLLCPEGVPPIGMDTTAGASGQVIDNACTAVADDTSAVVAKLDTVTLLMCGVGWFFSMLAGMFFGLKVFSGASLSGGDS